MLDNTALHVNKVYGAFIVINDVSKSWISVLLHSIGCKPIIMFQHHDISFSDCSLKIFLSIIIHALGDRKSLIIFRS